MEKELTGTDVQIEHKPTGRVFSIKIPLESSVEQLKQRIIGESNLPDEYKNVSTEYMSLYYRSSLLQPKDKSLSSFQIIPRSKLSLVFKLKTLDIFCLDVSASMFRSNSNSFLVSMLVGQSRVELAKKLIQDWHSHLKIEEEDNQDTQEEERYCSLMTFSETVLTHENWEGKNVGRFTEKQQKWLTYETAHVVCQSWFKGTNIYMAIKEAEKIINEFKSVHSSTSQVRVILHLLTDGCDTSSQGGDVDLTTDPRVPLITFLYSFSANFRDSHNLAKKLNANLIFVKDVGEAVQEQERLFYSNKVKPLISKKDLSNLTPRLEAYDLPTISSSEPVRTFSPHNMKFNLMNGENPEVKDIYKFLKTISPLFDDEEVLKTQGIFRKSESVEKVNQLVNTGIEGGSVSLAQIDPSNPHTAAHALKNLLKKSQPLLYREAQNKLLNVPNNDEHRAEKIVSIMKKDISVANLRCLKILFSILKRVEKYSDINMMKSTNLGIVFGPVLFSDADLDTMMSGGPSLIAFMIDHYDDIFSNVTS